MPTRRGGKQGASRGSPAKGRGGVSKRTPRGGASRGRAGRGGRGGRGGANNRASVDEAQKRLLQAKKTLQMAIQVLISIFYGKK